MRTMRTGLALAAVLAATASRAGTPLGGDDQGFVPPDKTTLTCESKVAKNVAKLIKAVATCHTKSASAGLKGKPFDEEACELAGRQKYDAANAKLVGCPPCLDAGAVADGEVARLDGIAAPLVYCDSTSGVFLGEGDDGGFVPPSTMAGKCQNLVTKNVAVLAKGLIKCHNTFGANAFKTGVPDQVAEEACEGAVLAKYTAKVGALPSCPACLTPGIRGALGAGAVASVDVNGGDVYCASPGGAFLNAGSR